MQQPPNSNIYFAAKPSKDTANILMSKAKAWFDRLTNNKYLDKLRNSWAAYHGAYFGSDGHEIIFTGEQGELVNIGVNHIRNLAQHILVMITGSRPIMEARSVNTDYKSLSQTILANELLDYYMREKRLEDVLRRAVEFAIVMGSGYIKMDWNSTSGEVYDYNEATQTEIHEGDVEFCNLSPLDVVYDTTKENPNDHDWVLCRSFKNKYDIAAKYPELDEKIRALPTKSDNNRFRFDVASFEETDDVTVYEFYHKRTECMPDGRYVLFLTPEIILLDLPIPYRNLPVFRLSPADILGTPYGYSSLFDLLPLQDALNSAMSTIISNHNAFGVQNIAMPDGCDVVPNQIAGGLNIFSYNPQFGKPEPINFLATSPESYKLMDVLERTMETISGVNSVARGNPQASLESGSALALVQSMSLQFMSGLQQSYVRTIEDVGTGLVNLLKDFATVPRIAAIVGRTNKTKMKQFTGDDLSSINRIICDVGNPLARSTAGRVQMAETLMQYAADKFTVDQYFQVIRTGKLDSATEGVSNEGLCIQAENERLIDGTMKVMAVITDDHIRHIRQHKNVLADPDLRYDPELLQRTLEHIQDHINLLKNLDPTLAGVLGEPQLNQGPPKGAPMPLSNPEAQGVAPTPAPPQMPQMPKTPQVQGPQ
jgi:hypothetical protein